MAITTIKAIVGEDEESKIIFTNGYVLTSEHWNDCCESHYLDFNMMKNYNIGTATGKPIDIYKQSFDFSKGVPFKRVDGIGILLYDTEGNKYLINGYGYNNGYYGTNIDLVLTYGIMVKYRYNVSECQEIDEY